MSSSKAWLIGKHVRHPQFGAGEVVEIRYGGLHARVSFHTGFTAWVRSQDLEFIFEDEPSHDIPEIHDEFSFYRLLETLKLGIVPASEITHFTFGRKEVIRTFERMMERVERGGGVFLLEGPYGSGKTHMLHCLSAQALQQGFAVMLAELDPFDVTPSRPKRVYRALVHELMWPESEHTIGTIHTILHKIREGEVLIPSGHAYFDRYDAIIKNLADGSTEWLDAWILGEPLDRSFLNSLKLYKLPVFLEHSTAVDHLTYLLSGWARIFKSIGLKGLIIFLDEAETAQHMHQAWERHRSTSTLQGLFHMGYNADGIDTVEGLYNDSYHQAYFDQYGRIHSGVRPLPYAYSKPTYMGIVVSVTPSLTTWYQNIVQSIHPEDRVVLWPLSDTDYYAILQYLIRIAHSLQPGIPDDEPFIRHIFENLKKNLWKHSETPPPRIFLKAAAELISYMLHTPSFHPHQINIPFERIYSNI